MISAEFRNKFTVEELRVLEGVSMWPPRRTPWTEKDLRTMLKLLRITFPEEFEECTRT